MTTTTTDGKAKRARLAKAVREIEGDAERWKRMAMDTHARSETAGAGRVRGVAVPRGSRDREGVPLAPG